MKKSSQLVFLVVCFAISPLMAQPARRGARPPAVPPPLLMEQLSRMTPKERDHVLGRLPSERRSVIEDRLRKYSEMPEPARRRLRDEYNLFQRLPPEKQQEMRKLFKQLFEFPEDRRRVLRRELFRLRNMTPDRRASRMNSARFKEDLTEDEREFLMSLTELFSRPAESTHNRASGP
jgi:hypothetical protein